jgi:NADPH-dependent curcumin reductase CurA
VPIGGVMRGAAIGKVVASKSAKYPTVTYVYASIGWTELAVLDENDKDMMKMELSKGGRLTDALGVLGLFPVSFLFNYPWISVRGQNSYVLWRRLREFLNGIK